jgi:hypothetical protein
MSSSSPSASASSAAESIELVLVGAATDRALVILVDREAVESGPPFTDRLAAALITLACCDDAEKLRCAVKPLLALLSSFTTFFHLSRSRS